MSFVRLLGMANFVPEQVDSKSEVVIEKGRRWLFHHLGSSHRHREDTGHRPGRVPGQSPQKAKAGLALSPN